MGPLVLLATSLLPDLIKLIAGDRAGTLAKSVEDAVKSVTGVDDAAKAKEKLADPAVAGALQVKLAQIALAASRQQLEDEDQRRRDEFSRLQESLKAEKESEGTVGARAMLAKLVEAGSSLQWVPAAISFVVILFFAVVLFALILPAKPADAETPYKELLNICIGALVAGFSTVISYWLGSSKGSRDKDATTRAQAIQAAVTQAPQPVPAPVPAPAPAPTPAPAPALASPAPAPAAAANLFK